MSDKLKEKPKQKSAVMGTLRDIFSRNPKKVDTKKQEKIAKERYATAFKAVATWRGKDVGVLAWLPDEHGAFNRLLNEAEKLKGSDPAAAADRLEAAKQGAEAADRQRERRMQVQSALKETYQGLASLSRDRSEVEACFVTAGSLQRKLDEGVAPDVVGDLLDDLNTETERVAKIKVGGETRGKLATARAEVQLQFNQALDGEVETTVGTARPLVKEAEVPFLEAELRTALEGRTEEFFDSLGPSCDNPMLTDEAEQVRALQERGAQALTDQANEAKAFRKELLADGAAGFVRAVKDRKTEDLEGSRLEAARQQFEQDFVAVAQAWSGLVDLGSPDAKGIGVDVTNDKALMLKSGAYDKSAMVIGALLEKIARARTRAEEAARLGQQAVGEEIVALRSELVKQKGGTDKRLKPAYDGLIAELDRVETLAATGNPGAFAAARQVMAGVRKAGLGGAVAVVAGLATMLDQVEAVTDDKVVAKEFSAETKEIRTATATVIAELDLYQTAQATKSLAGVVTQATALRGQADALVAWRAGVKQRLAALDKMIVEFRKAVPKTVGQTTFELNRAKVADAYRTVDVDRGATELLLRMAEGTVWPMLNNIRAGGDSMLEALNALGLDVKAAAKQTEDDEAAAAKVKQQHDDLRAGLKLFGEDLDRAEKLVKAAKPVGDKEELERLRTLYKQAKDRRTNDEEGARSQLASIRKDLDALLDTPGGATAVSVKALTQVDALWDQALQETWSLLEKVATSAELAAAQIALSPGEVKSRLDGLYSRFEAFKLVPSIRVLADDEADVKRRKQARETALRDIRAMRGLISGDPMVAKLSVNPFGVKAPFRKLGLFLDDMEYNSLRAVPVE